ncbi:META domain-containing protein [Marinifilum fragile]|uniref:META domain-containing protein n=1 Tax=Marinifilum fragile TaxID=570161 RepID=UPI002AAAF69E|nr:META domain-containing protein [Marinifilum fragile]
MNQRILFSALILFTLVLQSCSSYVNKIFWVGGFKTECSAGAGKMQCLNVNRSESLDNPNWENFYTNIKNFEFEEGYLQKIKVKETKLEENKVPADASSLEYKLIKVLDKQKDIRTELNGEWTLIKLNDAPLNRMVAIPTMTINLSNNLVSANGGCNNFRGRIQSLTSSKISLGAVAGTKRACIKKNIEPEFIKALNSIATYQIKGETLIFYNENGNKILDFIRGQGNKPNSRLHDIWITTRINQNPINRMSPVPRLEINLSEMKIMGNDGCNDFTGEIEEVSTKQLKIVNIASTNKMCRNMETAQSFNKALNQVYYYKLDGLNLILFNNENKEVLAFLKGD